MARVRSRSSAPSSLGQRFSSCRQQLFRRMAFRVEDGGGSEWDKLCLATATIAGISCVPPQVFPREAMRISRSTRGSNQGPPFTSPPPDEKLTLLLHSLQYFSSSPPQISGSQASLDLLLLLLVKRNYFFPFVRSRRRMGAIFHTKEREDMKIVCSCSALRP